MSTTNEAVTVALVDANGASLSGQIVANAVMGVASFSTLSVDQVGTYSLVASAAGVSLSSDPFDIVAGSPARLAFTIQPADVDSGVAMSAVVVQVLDAAGNSVDDATGTVTMSLATNPVEATLVGARSANITGGVATFTDLALNKAGQGYTLIARAPGLGEAESEPFSVIPGSADHLVFVQEPSNKASGAPMTVRVAVHDAEDNVVTAVRTVSLGLGSDPGNAALSGTITEVATVHGIATFSGISLDKAGQGYTLRARSVGLAPRESARFDVHAGAATQLAFLTEPKSARAGEALLPALQVEILDESGNRVEAAAHSVRIELLQNPGGTQLGGITTGLPSKGVATFPGLSLDTVAEGYQFVAKADGLTDARSELFDVTAAKPARLAFRAQPGTVTAGEPFAVEVEVRDAVGNLAEDATGLVRLRLGHGASDATLDGAVAELAGGVATFTELRIDKAPATYTLIAEAEGVASAESRLLSVEVGNAAALAFVHQPRQLASGEGFEVRVGIYDGEGNFLPDANDAISLALAGGPDGGSLSGAPVPVAAIGGGATFSALELDKMGEGYILVATGDGLTEARSESIDVVAPGAFARLSFLAQPRSGTADQALPPVKVEVLDAAGNRIRDLPQEVVLALETHPDGGSLSGQSVRQTVNGVATFDRLFVDRAASGYRLVASSGSVPTVPSEPFDILAGEASRLAFSVVPEEVPSGAPFDLEVEIQDSAGNRVDVDKVAVSLIVGQGEKNAFFGDTLVDAVGGTARFEGLWLDERGSFTLEAFGHLLEPGESPTIEVVARPTALIFDVEPPNPIAAGKGFSVTVQVLDELDAPMPNAVVPVSLRLGDPALPFNGTLTMDTTEGRAVFTHLSFEDAAPGYILYAESPGLLGAESAPFQVANGPPVSLKWDSLPETVASGENIHFSVELFDAFGNPALVNVPELVTLALDRAQGDPAAQLSGTTAADVVGGEASFISRIDKVGTYRVIATYPGAPDAPSGEVVVIPGAPVALHFTSSPDDPLYVREVFDAELVVTDAAGNRTDSTAELRLGLECDGVPVAFPADPSELTKEAVGGKVAFSGLRLVDPLRHCVLIATSDGLQQVVSSPFHVVEVEQQVVKGITFLRMPAGTFTPGCATKDAWGQVCSGGEATETLPSFWMMQTPVTLAHYEACVKDSGACAPASDDDPYCNWGSGKLDHPINCVTAENAEDFCEWVGGSLPTDLEAEYAARSGRDIVFPWGNALPNSSRANYNDGGPVIGTTPVDAYPQGQSIWGLLDMAGNVSEIIKRDDEGLSHWTQGGSFNSSAAPLRSYIFGPVVVIPGQGFRCMMPDPP